MSTKPDFVHLHLHTEFSLLDGASSLDELVSEGARMGMRAMAITDHGNMFGAVAFHDACREKGLKPILGCEVYVATGSRFERQAASASEAYNHFTLLATNDAGYHNLVKLVSAGYLEGFYHRPRVDKELLAKHSEGLVGLSAASRARSRSTSWPGPRARRSRAWARSPRSWARTASTWR